MYKLYRHNRHLVLYLLTLAILAQAMIPLGYMPSFNKNAGSFITICSGFSTKTVYIDSPSPFPDEQNNHGNRDNHKSNHCIFTGAAIKILLDGMPFGLNIPDWDSITLLPLDIDRPSGIDRSRHHARGPPA